MEVHSKREDDILRLWRQNHRRLHQNNRLELLLHEQVALYYRPIVSKDIVCTKKTKKKILCSKLIYIKHYYQDQVLQQLRIHALP